MIQSLRHPLAVAVLGIVAMPSLARCQQGYDLINDLDLLVPVAAKNIDAMLEADIDEMEDGELDQIEATFTAAERARRILNRYKDYFRDLHDRELLLLHAVVQLKRSEFEPVNEKLNKGIRKAYLGVVQDVLNLENAEKAGWKRVAREEDSVSRAIREVQDKLVQLVEAELDAKRGARYKTEIDARRDFAKEAMIESMTTSLSLKFVFSISQREILEQIIREHWQESWRGNASSVIEDGVGSVRGFPKDELFNLLRETQKVFFESIQWEPKPDRSEFAIHSQIAIRKSALWDLAKELDFAAEEDGQEQEQP